MYLTLDDRRTSQRDPVCLDGALKNGRRWLDPVRRWRLPLGRR